MCTAQTVIWRTAHMKSYSLLTYVTSELVIKVIYHVTTNLSVDFNQDLDHDIKLKY